MPGGGFIRTRGFGWTQGRISASCCAVLKPAAIIYFAILIISRLTEEDRKAFASLLVQPQQSVLQLKKKEKKKSVWILIWRLIWMAMAEALKHSDQHYSLQMTMSSVNITVCGDCCRTAFINLSVANKKGLRATPSCNPNHRSHRTPHPHHTALTARPATLVHICLLLPTSSCTSSCWHRSMPSQNPQRHNATPSTAPSTFSELKLP